MKCTGDAIATSSGNATNNCYNSGKAVWDQGGDIPDMISIQYSNSHYNYPIKTHEAAIRNGSLENKTKISIAAIATLVIVLALFHHSPTTQALSATQILSNNKYALYDKGDVLISKGNYTQAIQYFDKALAIDPNDKYALYDKGNALNYLGNYTEAITYLDKALAIDPNYKWALLNKGDALDSLGKHAQAIQYFDKALAIDPKFKYALSYKGRVLSNLGNYSGALTYLDKALAIDPHDKFVIYGLAQAKRLHQLTQVKP